MTDDALSPLLESIRFSISDTTGQHPRELTEMHRWLVGHPDAWRLSRSDLISDDRRLSSGSLLVTGEAGCGKTTLLAEEADFFRRSSNNLVLHVNFLDADRLDQSTKEDDIVIRLGQFLTSQIEAAVGRYDRQFGLRLWDDYTAARIREIIEYEGGDFLTAAKGRYISAVGDMPVADIIANEELMQAHQNHTRSRREILIGYKAIQRTLSIKRIVMMFDNLDNIGGRNAGLVLGSVLKARKSKTLLYCALRSENEYAAAYLSAFISDRIRMSTPDMAQIIAIRTHGVKEFHQDTHKKLPRGSAAISADAVKAMRNLQTDRNGTRILEKWHNTNIRQMMTFVAVNRRKLASAKDETQLHGALLSSLIWHVDERTDFLLSLLNPLDNSAAGLPFLFLKLRILAFLRKHGPEVEQSRLFSTFQKYRVDSREVDGALRTLYSPTLVGGAFLRSVPDGAKKMMVSLLPAGDLFLCEIAYSVEFLGYQEEKRGGKQEWDPIGRLWAATSFVKSRMLPAFRDEHPYVRTNWHPKPEDQKRLRSYRQDFGYATDQWFISGLSRSLLGYAKNNGFILDDRCTASEGLSGEASAAVELLRETTAAIRNMERSLNALLVHEFEG